MKCIDESHFLFLFKALVMMNLRIKFSRVEFEKKNAHVKW